MDHRRALGSLAALLAAALLDGTQTPAAGAGRQDENKKPSVTLKASPPIAFSPARIRLVAEIRGGADNYEEYYCPTVEWDWGDGTISENTQDCDPYDPAKSTIRRRMTAEHTYRMAGNFKVFLRLKRKDKTMGSANTNVQVRPGLRDQSFPYQ